MSQKKRTLDNNSTINETEPPPKKRKITSNPYLTTEDNDNNDDWWKGNNTTNDDTIDKEEQHKNELIDYFANIDFMIENESFDNNENEQIFINNIIKEMDRFDDTIFIFEHPDISKVIEKIIQILPSIYIRQFIQKFILPNLLPLITKKCSSHVLQTLFSLIPTILIQQQSNHTNNNSETVNTMSDLLVEIINKLKQFEHDNNGLSQLFIDEKSTFVIRDLLWISCGVVRFNKTKKKHRMKLHNVRKIPQLKKFGLDHVPENVIEFGNDIAMNLLQYRHKYKLSTHIKHHKYRRDKHSNILCGSLGVLIECLFITKTNNILQELIDEILIPPPAKQKKNMDKNKKKKESNKDRIKKHILELILNESSSHLMQIMFEFGNKNVSLNIVKNYLNAKDIRNISLDNNGNYVLQSMLRKLFDVKSIQFIASSVQHNINELFEKNKIGVLYCLINAFTRGNLKPNAMVKTILKQINQQTQLKNDNIIYKFLYLNLNEKDTQKNLMKSKIMPLSSKYSVLGCLLLQSIIKCNSVVTASVYKALLLLDKNEIIKICRDSSGSHVIQAFMECKYVFDNIKWEFLNKIQDRFHTLCVDKFGNYIMECTFFSLNFPYKKQFVQKVLNSEAVLKGSRIGLILYGKMKLELFKQDENKWKQNIMKHKRHRKNFVKMNGNRNRNMNEGYDGKNKKMKKSKSFGNGSKQNKGKFKGGNNKSKFNKNANNKGKFKGRKTKKYNKLF